MREISESHVDDDFLKNVWFCRLPVLVQTILSVNYESLNKLAEMADKICECTHVIVNSLDLRESETGGCHKMAAVFFTLDQQFRYIQNHHELSKQLRYHTGLRDHELLVTGSNKQRFFKSLN